MTSSPLFSNPFDRGAALLRPSAEAPPGADVVLLVEASPGMESFWRQLALDLPALDALAAQLSRLRGIPDGGLRLRIIAFRDLYMYTRPFETTPFLHPGDGTEQLLRFVNRLELHGEACPHSSGLEALLVAMHSPWRHEPGVRQRIVLLSGSSAYALTDPLRRIDPHYGPILRGHIPDGHPELPGDLLALRLLWRDGVGSMDNWSRRLLLYSPPVFPWPLLRDWPDVESHPLPEGDLRALRLPQLLQDVFATL